ncbi:hypothetical protein [Streptomyces sp. NPDC018693]
MAALHLAALVIRSASPPGPATRPSSETMTQPLAVQELLAARYAIAPA